MSNTILINDVSINGNTELNTASKLSETLQENTVNALGVDASSRTIWVNGQPYGNAYVNIKDANTVEAPLGAEIFNDFVNNKATGQYSHAEGNSTTASGENSHAEGQRTTAYGPNSHAEGWALTEAPTIEAADIENGFVGLIAKWNADPFSLAYGKGSHVEGQDNLALGDNSHAEGGWTKAYGAGSHVEGGSTISIGRCSHAEGYDTTAQGLYSHTEGEGTITTLGNDAEHAQGRYNVSNTNTIHSVGIGTSINDRKNAYEILKTGKHYIYNLGGYDGTNPSDSKDIATILSTVDTSDTNGFTVENTLTVTGETTLKDKLSVTNGGLAVTGASQLTGNVAIGTDSSKNTLTVFGTTTLKDKLSVTNGGLAVTGATTLSSTLAVDGATTLNGNVSLGNSSTDNIYTYGNIITSVNITGDTTTTTPALTIYKNYGKTNVQQTKIDGVGITSNSVSTNNITVKNGNTDVLNVSLTECKVGSKLTINDGTTVYFKSDVNIAKTDNNGAFDSASNVNLNVSGNITSYGNMYAPAFYERSDATKKDIVSNLDVDFDKLKQIPKVNFTWKNDESKQNNIGTIAQDLNKVYPELVNGEEGNMTVDYA